MAPKRAVGKRSARAPPSTEQERRIKRREEEQRTEYPVEDSHSGAPSSPSQVPSMSTRTVTSGRHVNFEFLRGLGLKIGELIEYQGWRTFCSLDERVYPTLVRTFYENLKLGVNHVESVVKGKRVFVNEATLHGSVEIPSEGLKYLVIENREELLKTILNKEEVEGIRTVMANTLSLKMRLLHNFISRIFIQRTGRFDWVTEKDLCLMDHIMKKTPVSLSTIIILQMKEAVRRVKASLPYGMLLTVLFKSHHVNLEGEDSVELHHTDIYSSKTLERMGYHRVEGIWRKKGSNIRAIGSSSNSRDDEDEEEFEETAGTSIPEPATRTEETAGDFDMTPPDLSAPAVDEPPSAPPPSAPQTSSIPLQFEDQMRSITDTLTNTITSLFSNLKTSVDSRLDRMEDHVVSLQEKVEALEHSRTTQQLDLQPILNSISSSSQSILNSVDSTLNNYQTELKELRTRVGTIMETRSMEEDYTKGVGLLRSEFGRLHGSAEAFANVQATELISMQKEINEMKQEMERIPKSMENIVKQLGGVWMEVITLTNSVTSLETSIRSRPVNDPPPMSSRGPSSSSHPRAPPPHASSSRFRPQRSWQGANVDSDSE